ncbi:MAG: hypothetical protein LAP21_05625 [Acidobacteriia bacterium]|nr:hypothetical protein [Terriglobia bacterium]
MTIHLRPELEELIRQDVERGAYETIDDFVEQAVSLLHEQEVWLAQHKSEIAARIQVGFAAAQHGDLIEPEQARSILEERKREWAAKRKA